jgi:glucose-6-phosphate 1-dehydrogenase
MAGSNTDTFFAFKTELNSKRFRGLPIYVRAGKMLQRTATEIAIVFKLPVNRIFKDLDCGLENNILIYRIQPNEGIVLKILSRAPGYEKKIVPSFMQFCYRDLPGEPKDAYENLIQNALEGDQTFFNDAPEIEAQWKFTDKLIKKKREVHVYKKGSWGPKASDKMIQKDGREWIMPSLAFCKR